MIFFRIELSLTLYEEYIHLSINANANANNANKC